VNAENCWKFNENAEKIKFITNMEHVKTQQCKAVVKYHNYK